MTETALALHGVEKSFGTTHVLHGVDLSLPAGEVTVLMGANGAGKSTLVRILSGVYRADAGHMQLFGKAFEPETPSAAMRSGVVTVHQHINDGVVPDLDVATNLMLEHLASGRVGIGFRRGSLRRRAAEIAANMDLDLDMRQPVSSLSLADRQLVAIARAMAYDPRVLILDEPTSSLSATEAERLFALVDRLRESGVAVLYISHRMSDIRRIADRIVSMRDGRIVGEFDQLPLDIEAAVNAMLGQIVTVGEVHVQDAGDVVLQLNGVCLQATSAPIDLTLHTGEVVAIAGLVGSGKSALVDVLFGEQQAASGRMRLQGKDYAPIDATDAIAQGVFLCPKDRATNSIVPEFDLTANITMPFVDRFSTFGFLRRRRERASADETLQRLGVVCRGNRDRMDRLSGGNQQKVVVGRWLSQRCRLLLLDEPFQGVDIQARRDIGRILRATADDRATLIMVTELDEALEVADRILVMVEHTLVGEHRNQNIDTDRLLAEVAGSAR